MEKGPSLTEDETVSRGLVGTGSIANRGCLAAEGCMFEIVAVYAEVVVKVGASSGSTPLGVGLEEI